MGYWTATWFSFPPPRVKAPGSKGYIRLQQPTYKRKEVGVTVWLSSSKQRRSTVDTSLLLPGAVLCCCPLDDLLLFSEVTLFCSLGCRCNFSLSAASILA